MDYPNCNCFVTGGMAVGRARRHWIDIRFHTDVQDTTCMAWKKLLDLIEEAAMDERDEFAPGRILGKEAWGRIITLPPTIAKLKHVEHLNLYESNLVRIPPEIGEMRSLRVFTPYASWRLHWFPYEITRCHNLHESTVSTRALYGNFKSRPPFPELSIRPVHVSARAEQDHLPSAEPTVRCSVCNSPFIAARVLQVWVSLQVGTDVLPLLVNACSYECINKLPEGAMGYVREPHKGGVGMEQPPPRLGETIE